MLEKRVRIINTDVMMKEEQQEKEEQGSKKIAYEGKSIKSQPSLPEMGWRINVIGTELEKEQ